MCHYHRIQLDHVGQTGKAGADIWVCRGDILKSPRGHIIILKSVLPLNPHAKALALRTVADSTDKVSGVEVIAKWANEGRALVQKNECLYREAAVTLHTFPKGRPRKATQGAPRQMPNQMNQSCEKTHCNC